MQYKAFTITLGISARTFLTRPSTDTISSLETTLGERPYGVSKEFLEFVGSLRFAIGVF